MKIVVKCTCPNTNKVPEIKALSLFTTNVLNQLRTIPHLLVIKSANITKCATNFTIEIDKFKMENIDDSWWEAKAFKNFKFNKLVSDIPSDNAMLEEFEVESCIAEDAAGRYELVDNDQVETESGIKLILSGKTAGHGNYVIPKTLQFKRDDTVETLSIEQADVNYDVVENDTCFKMTIHKFVMKNKTEQKWTAEDFKNRRLIGFRTNDPAKSTSVETCIVLDHNQKVIVNTGFAPRKDWLHASPEEIAAMTFEEAELIVQRQIDLGNEKGEFRPREHMTHALEMMLRYARLGRGTIE